MYLDNIENPSFLVATTCAQYWKRFSYCSKFWNEEAEKARKVGIKVTLCASHQEPVPEEHPVQGFNMVPYEAPERDIRKGMLLRSLMKFLPGHQKIIFTDADVVPPVDLFEMLAFFYDKDYIVADRIELNEEETDICLESGALPGIPKDELTHRIELKKRGMGWFQCVSVDVLNKIASKLPWSHEGYDLFDWVLNRDIVENFGEPYVIQQHFYHLWHGASSANWKGADRNW